MSDRPDAFREMLPDVVDVLLKRIDTGLTLEELRAELLAERDEDRRRVAAVIEQEAETRRAAHLAQEEARATAGRSGLKEDEQVAFNHFVEAMVSVYLEEYDPDRVMKRAGDE